MATSNFHTTETDTVFVIDYGDDEFMWQECHEHIANHIKELCPTFEPNSDLTSQAELRSFPASSIGYWEFDLCYLNPRFTFRVNLFIRSGYYSAANLDYESEWLIDDDDCYGSLESPSDVIEELINEYERYDVNPGILAIHSNRLESKLDNLTSESIKLVESLLSQVSTPYGVTARFNNGETMYEKLEESS